MEELRSVHRLNAEPVRLMGFVADEHEDQKETIVVADSLDIVREGIKSRLERVCNIAVVGEACDGRSAVEACQTLQPSVLLLDDNLADPASRTVLSEVVRTCVDTKVIVLSSESTATNAYFVLSQGAVGYLPKRANSEDFINAIAAAIRGFSYLPSEFLQEFIEVRHNVNRTNNMFGLSRRELGILEACINGQSNKDIANSFDISVRTVESHKNSIYRKTSCRSQRELTSLVDYFDLLDTHIDEPEN